MIGCVSRPTDKSGDAANEHTLIGSRPANGRITQPLMRPGGSQWACRDVEPRLQLFTILATLFCSFYFLFLLSQ
jgi:hypothetical protein